MEVSGRVNSFLKHPWGTQGIRNDGSDDDEMQLQSEMERGSTRNHENMPGTASLRG